MFIFLFSRCGTNLKLCSRRSILWIVVIIGCFCFYGTQSLVQHHKNNPQQQFQSTRPWSYRIHNLPCIPMQYLSQITYNPSKKHRSRPCLSIHASSDDDQTFLDNKRNSNQNTQSTMSFQERPPAKSSSFNNKGRRNYNNNNNAGYNPIYKKGGKKANNRGSGKYMNEYAMFNTKITQQENAMDLLQLLASRKDALSAIAGGTTMSTVNFATAMHRIAKHLSTDNKNDDQGNNNRPKVLSDPRFALLMCSVGEAILDGAEIMYNPFSSPSNDETRKEFGARELSNVVWALAKINIVPPDSVTPVSLETAELNLRNKSEELRSIIFDIARQKASGSESTRSSKQWIPVLSELCGYILDTASVKSLQLDPREFEQQELSNIMWGLTTAKRPNEKLFDFIVNSIILSLEKKRKDAEDLKLDPREWSIPLWCLAKTGMSSGIKEQLLPFIYDLIENESGFLESCGTQELSNTAWATATILSNQPTTVSKGPISDAALGILRHTCREVIRRKGEGYKSQEITNTAWAMATVGFGITAEQSVKDCQQTHTYTYLPSDDPEGDRVLMEETLLITMDRLKQNCRYYKSQELNNMCWAMARLDEKDEDLLEIIGEELLNPRRRLEPQDLSMSLWSMATLEYSNKNLYRDMAGRVNSLDPRKFKPRELSNTLWALATADVAPLHPSAFDVMLLPDDVRPNRQQLFDDPVTTCFMNLAQEFMRRPDSFKTQEIKDVVWSFARTGTRHPELFRFTAEYLVGEGNDSKVSGRGLSDFNSQGRTNLAYSYARQAQLGAETLEKYGANCNLPATGGRLARYTTSFLDVGEGLLRKLFAEIARVNLEVDATLSNMNPQDISNTIWAFAILGFKHNQYLAATNEAIQRNLERFVNGESNIRPTGQELANAIWAMAALSYKPVGLVRAAEAFIMELLDNKVNSTNILKFFTRQELSNMAWAFAVFAEYPLELIEVIYIGLLGSDDDSSDDQEWYGNSKTITTQRNSIVTLQIMMDLDLGRDQHPFSLPEDFSEARTKLSPKRGSKSKLKSSDSFSLMTSDDNDMMNTGFLELSTSTTQASVSQSFHRIGFPHVDEYVLTMADLAEEYQVSIPSLPVELLSMDIANVEEKIGVEMDGPGHFITVIDNDYDINQDYQDIISTVGRYDVSKSGKLEYNFYWSSKQQEINGSTNLKIRLFEKLGWRIINIPFWDWISLFGKEEKQDQFCQKLLDE